MYFKLLMFQTQPEINRLKSAFIGYSYFSSERVHIIIWSMISHP